MTTEQENSYQKGFEEGYRAGYTDDYQRRIMQKVANEYGCEFNNDELLSNDSTVLLQAMLAVYAWLKLKEMD